MKTYWMFAAVGLGALLAQGTVSAHHSFAAEFDRNQKVTITGSVTKVEWENPHARFYVDAKDEGSGDIVNWRNTWMVPAGIALFVLVFFLLFFKDNQRTAVHAEVVEMV